MAEDVISLIMTDHREVERLLDLMKKDAASRPLALPVVLAMLTAHSRAEEEHVYPVLAKQAGERGKAHHGTEEHEEAEELGHRLLALDPQSAQFDEGLTEFVDNIRHHVQEEEDDLLPSLREATGEAQLKRMAVPFAKRRAQELTGRPMGGLGGDETRAELYEEAKDLGVAGRSHMTKDELAQEVDRQRG